MTRNIVIINTISLDKTDSVYQILKLLKGNTCASNMLMQTCSCHLYVSQGHHTQKQQCMQ